MARPLSEEKRNAILMAAAENVATDGLAARTAKIATAAGVAEGTVFTYFATKETQWRRHRCYLDEQARSCRRR